MKIEIIISMVMVAFLALAVVKADDVNMEINVNGTANMNISIDTEDTELREDVYGTEGNSPAEDLVLQYIDEHKDDPNPGWEEVREFCNDPAFKDYFDTLSSVPPEAFILHMKSLGYDDVGQITLIWSMCLEEKINENEEGWSTDKGVSQGGVANMITGAIEWLLGINDSPIKEQVDIATSLDSYFASDRDTSYLLRRINDLTFRIEALENTINDIASEAYCMGKLKVMMDYGLEGVRCDDTTYFNHQLTPEGEDMVIGITPVNGIEENGEEPEIPEEIPFEEEVEDTEEILASSGVEEMNLEKNKVVGALTLINSRMNDLTRGVLLLVSSYTLTILIVYKTFPTVRGYVFREMTSGVKVLSSFMMDKTFNATSNVITALRSDRRKEEKFTYSFGKGWVKA